MLCDYLEVSAFVKGTKLWFRFKVFEKPWRFSCLPLQIVTELKIEYYYRT